MVYIVLGLMLAVAVGAIFTQRSRNVRGQPGETLPGAETAEGTAAREGAADTSADAMMADAMAPNAAISSEPAPDTVLLSPEAGKREEPAAPHVPETLVSKTPAPDTQASETQTQTHYAEFGVDEEIIPLKPMLAAETLSSPSALNSATYTSLAQTAASKDSPYAYGNAAEEPKPKATLLRWSGKTGAIQIGDMTVRGPVAYWSEGPGTTYEPSCIDVTLPVEYPAGDSDVPAEGAASYNEMTPLQRGVYLRWLAGGRIQPPPHACYPIVWLFGLERRVLADRLDMGVCIGEAFRLLPLVRWESLRQGLIKFITWLAAKIWMPEEELLAFSRSLPVVPKEILNMLLNPYADMRLPLPSVVAFTVMRASSLAADSGLEQPGPFMHSEELLNQFAPKYKLKCEGGLVLPKPKTSVFVAYVPTNPTLAVEKKVPGGVLELPDFFKEAENFAPLVAAWKEFLKSAFPHEAEPLKASDALGARPDWESFILNLQGTEQTAEQEISGAPALTNLGALGDLLGIDRPRDGKKADAAARKKISEAARVEGFLVVPDLGIAGKEYGWDEPVALAPFLPGSRLPQSYSAAALILEYFCALSLARQQGSDTSESGISGVPDAASLSLVKDRLENYFSLSSEDNARLEMLCSVLAASPAAEPRMNPDNIGESMQFWLQREQRVTFGEFMAGVLTEFAGERNLIGVLSQSLGVETLRAPAANNPDNADIPAAENGEEGKEIPRPLEPGNKIVQALSPLFTD